MPLGDATKRLALVNMDWDNVRAVNLYVLLSSFCPTGGSVKLVTVYPSEFGKERLEHEEKYGPPKEVFGATVTDDAAELDAISKEESRMKELKRAQKHHVSRMVGEVETSKLGPVELARIRKYQLERLRYYYAVVECNSVETAKHLYDECNGLEFESSGNLIDLRFIPDDVTFDDEPRDTASHLPQNYQPAVFTTKALRHSNPELTWEAEDHERVQVTKRKFNKEDIKKMDFEAYLANSDDSDDDDDDGPIETVQDSDEDGEEVKLKSKKRDAYRSLLSEISAKEEPEEEMEITFTAGLSGVADKLVKEKKKKNVRLP